MASREAVMTALLALLSSTGDFVTISRRNRSPESLGVAESPALMLVEHSETIESRSRSLPPIRRLRVSAILYNDIGPTYLNTIPATAINNALDNIDLALRATGPSGQQTLGGLVESVQVSGEIEKAPGDRTGKSVAVVPIEITLP